MALAEGDRQRLKDDKLALEIDDLLHRYQKRRDPELESVLADIKLKNRQHSTEVWKLVIAAIAAGAVLGGVAVRTFFP